MGPSKLCRGLALLAILAGSNALAASPRPRIALLGLATDVAGPGQLVDAAIAQRLRDRDLEVVPQRGDAPFGPGCARGPDATKCEEELAGSLGVDYLLCATLDPQPGGGATLTLTLLDRKGQPVSEIGKVVPDRSPASLGEAVEEEIPKVVQPLCDAGPPAPVAIEVPERSHVASYAILVSGAVLLLGSGAVGYAADSADSALDNAVSGATSGNIPALRSSVGTEAWVSTGLMLAGVAAIAVGVILFYAGGSGDAPRAGASAAAPTLGWTF